MRMTQSFTCVPIAVWLLDDFLSHSINICLSSVGILQLTQLRSRCYSAGSSPCPSFPSSSLSSLVLSFQLPFQSIFILCLLLVVLVSPPPVSTYSRPASAYPALLVMLMTNAVYVCVCVCDVGACLCVCERETLRAVHTFLWHSCHSLSVALCRISTLSICVCERDLMCK